MFSWLFALVVMLFVLLHASFVGFFCGFVVLIVWLAFAFVFVGLVLSCLFWLDGGFVVFVGSSYLLVIALLVVVYSVLFVCLLDLVV